MQNAVKADSVTVMLLKTMPDWNPFLSAFIDYNNIVGRGVSPLSVCRHCGILATRCDVTNRSTMNTAKVANQIRSNATGARPLLSRTAAIFYDEATTFLIV